MNLWLKIIICVVAIQLTGALSGLLGAGSIGTVPSRLVAALQARDGGQ